MELISQQVRERVESSGLLEAGEQATVYVNGPRSSALLVVRAIPLLTLLTLPWLTRSMRAFVATDRNVYVFTMKFGRGGAVKSILVKRPHGTARADVLVARGRKLKLTLEDEVLYIGDQQGSRLRAEALVAAATRSSRD